MLAEIRLDILRYAKRQSVPVSVVECISSTLCREYSVTTSGRDTNVRPIGGLAQLSSSYYLVAQCLTWSSSPQHGVQCLACSSSQPCAVYFSLGVLLAAGRKISATSLAANESFLSLLTRTLKQ
eukprot:scpid90004/ scgid25623/ 